MHRSRIIVIIGAIVALLPLLGFPSSWEAFFQVVAGLSIVGISVWSQIDRKLSQKAKAQMRQIRKHGVPAETIPAESSKFAESLASLSKRVTDFYPKTGQNGRRASDLKATQVPEPNLETTPEESVI